MYPSLGAWESSAVFLPSPSATNPQLRPVAQRGCPGPRQRRGTREGPFGFSPLFLVLALSLCFFLFLLTSWKTLEASLERE